MCIKRLRAQTQPISPCGRFDFHYDESLGTRCTSNKQNGRLAQSVGLYTNFSWQVEPCHGGVRVMRQENFNFGIRRGRTNTAFMPERQRVMAVRYVKLLMFLLFTSKSALTKSKRY